MYLYKIEHVKGGDPLGSDAFMEEKLMVRKQRCVSI